MKRGHRGRHIPANEKKSCCCCCLSCKDRGLEVSPIMWTVVFSRPFYYYLPRQDNIYYAWFIFYFFKQKINEIYKTYNTLSLYVFIYDFQYFTLIVRSSKTSVSYAYLKWWELHFLTGQVRPKQLNPIIK